MIKIILLLLLQVWTPDRNCYTVLDVCGDFEYQRAFNYYMTGPDTYMKLIVPGKRPVKFDVSQLRANYKKLDWDDDGDIDLRDYAIYVNEVSH